MQLSIARASQPFRFRRFASLGAGLLLTVSLCAQSVIRSIPGATGDHLGGAICDAGDVNGDGWNDYLVGAPGANGGRGGVVCISGKYLATNIAPAQLYSFYPLLGQVSADAAFGSAIANLGDVTGDNVPDFAVGAPLFDVTGGTDGGAVLLLNGATHLLSGLPFPGGFDNQRGGWSLSATSDVDGDGYRDVLVGGPSTTGAGTAWLVSGRSLSLAHPVAILTMYPLQGQAGDLFGYAVLGGVDFDGDGVPDFVMAAPGMDNGSADRGLIRIVSGAGNHAILLDYWGLPGQKLGISLASGADFDGDGRQDLVVGASLSSTGMDYGGVVLLSPQHIINGVPPFQIFAWDGPPPGGFYASNFGASVAVAPDLNGDGRADVLVGLPRYAVSQSSMYGNYGAVAIYSGLTGARMGWITGATRERIGSAVLGSVNDLDGDGRHDFVVGGTNASTPTLDCGVFKAVALFPSLPVNYCIGKVNSLGCTPAINFNGSASATSPAPFLIGASNVINKRNGLLFYGFGPLANPFQGGLLCVKAPTIRTVIQSSGGSATGADCTGSFSFDFNAYIRGGGHPNLAVGAEVFCQYWSRDPQSPGTTSLSDALDFVVNP